MVVAGYLGSLGPMFRVFATTFLVALIAGCATSIAAPPVVVEVLPDTYRVGNVTLNTPADLKAYLLQQGIGEIRLLFPRGFTNERALETLVVAREAGVSIGITGSLKE